MYKQMKLNNKKFENVRLVLYIVSIIIAIIALITNYQSSCYWRDRYGILCPACGLTRATISFMKLNFKAAFEYNAFYTCILLPFILFLVINDLYTILKRKTTRNKDISFVEIILGEAKNEQN